jgi:protein TonB
LIISSQSVPTEELQASTPSVAGDIGRISLGGNVAAARLLNKVAPLYPAEARRDGIQGTVRLRAIIGKDGLIKDLQVITGHPALTDAALAAVRQWSYQPTLLEGRPVEVSTEIDVVFRLNATN